jgi:tetratricopeptide (TPR) repeat protein
VSSGRSSISRGRPLAGATLVFSGRLITLDRREARALAELLGAAVADDVTAQTTVVVVGAHADGGGKLRRAEQINSDAPGRIRIVSEDEFCEIGCVPSPSMLRQQFQAKRDLMERYRHLRDDHLQYLQKCGLVRPGYRTAAETFYKFADVSVLRQVEAELAAGASFRSTARSLLAARAGQLALDFRIDAAPAKVVELKPRPVPPLAALMDPHSAPETSSAEQFFLAASVLDDGDEGHLDDAAFAYRKALEIDPYLVPALINLANIHYARDEMAEAQALYERAIVLEPDVFEAHYNLGNIYHDLGRFVEAQRCYREALRMNPAYADAHFYLAVTLEKNGQSQEARPHWRAYQQLAPQGEWVELAKEFSE